MPNAGGGLAAQIDSYLKGKGSPMAGMGNVFVAAGKKYGVDPRLTVAISGAESTFGKYLFAPYNAWGWMSDDRYAWGNWETGINKVSKGLASGYINQGLTTPATIVNKYNPADPANREHWSNTVSTFLRELGATPSTTTTKKVVKATSPSPVPAATALTVAVPPFKPMVFTPTSAGLTGALQSNLATIAQRGHLSGGEMLANINAGTSADQTANLQSMAQVDAYNRALAAAAKQSTTTPPSTTTTPSSSDTTAPSTDTTGKFEPVKGKYASPLGATWKVGSTPAGHTAAANAAGKYQNWESKNAYDLYVPEGTPVYAVANGVIGSQFGSLDASDPKLAGLRLHLEVAGNELYYAHLSRFAKGIAPGSKVKAGQLLGYSGSANGVAHLHFASENGDPSVFFD